MSGSFDYAAQPKERVEACNLCGKASYEQFATRDRYGLPVQSVTCLGCGLVFLTPRMTAAAYRDFYRDGDYRALLSEFHGRPVTAETIEADQVGYAERLIKLLEPHVSGQPFTTMLDVGGSTGVVAEAVAQQFGLVATVLEPSDAEGDRAALRGLKIIPGTIEQCTIGTDRYDLVLLCQTVDHLTDIRQALRTIRGLLAEGGLFFVDIVDYRVPLRKVGREGAIKVDHPYYLEPWTMDAYLAQAGFERLHSQVASDGMHVDFVCGAA